MTSFQAVHCKVSRSETEWLDDRSFVLTKLCRESRLNPAPPIAPLIYSLRAGGVVRRAEVRAELHQVPNDAIERSHHEFRVWRELGEGHRPQQTEGH